MRLLLILLALGSPVFAQQVGEVDPYEVCRVQACASSCIFDVGGPPLVAQLAPGNHTRAELGLMLEGALWAADSTGIYQVYLQPSTGHYLIDRLDAGAGPGELNLRVSTSCLCWRLFGFTGADRTGGGIDQPYESDTVAYCPSPGASCVSCVSND